MSYRYADKAVRALTSVLSTSLEANIEIIEAETGLSLQVPKKYMDAAIETDNISPLVIVYDSASRCINQRINQWETDCQVLMFFSGDADALKGNRKARAYGSAIIATIRNDVTLSGAVDAAEVQDYASDLDRGDKSVTRHLIQIGVKVTYLED